MLSSCRRSSPRTTVLWYFAQPGHPCGSSRPPCTSIVLESTLCPDNPCKLQPTTRQGSKAVAPCRRVQGRPSTSFEKRVRADPPSPPTIEPAMSHKPNLPTRASQTRPAAVPRQQAIGGTGRRLQDQGKGRPKANSFAWATLARTAHCI